MTLRSGATVAGCAALLSACSLPGSGSPSASPSFSAATSTTTASPAASPSAPSVVTVLAQLGLNIHAQPSTAAPVLGVASQDTTLTVLATQQSGATGWYRVQGQTVTGWVVADPALVAPGLFTAFNSSQLAFGALYPQSWTFAVSSGAVVFRPQQGNQTIVVRVAASPSAFGATPDGYIASFSQQEVVCGYTGTLVEYVLGAGMPTPSPQVSGTTMLPRYADIRLSFDPAHAMDLSFNYVQQSDLSTFQDVYNSLVVPYAQCQKAATSSP